MEFWLFQCPLRNCYIYIYIYIYEDNYKVFHWRSENLNDLWNNLNNRVRWLEEKIELSANKCKILHLNLKSSGTL